MSRDQQLLDVAENKELGSALLRNQLGSPRTQPRSDRARISPGAACATIGPKPVPSWMSSTRREDLEVTNTGRSRVGGPEATPPGAGAIPRHAAQIALAAGRIMAYNNNRACVARGQHRAEISSHLHLCGPGWASERPRASVSPLAAQECAHPADTNCKK